MDDHRFPLVALHPGEVVVVLDMCDRPLAQELRDVPVDHLVVGRRVFAHQVHRRPVFLACLAIEVEPRQPPEVLVLRRQFAWAIPL